MRIPWVVLVQELLLKRSATAESLQVSLRRHADLSLHTLTLLEAQRLLLDHLEAQLAKRQA